MTRNTAILTVLCLLGPEIAIPAEAPWGAPLDGLSCRLTGPAEVRQGDRLVVALELRHDGAHHGALTHITDWWAGYCTTLRLVGPDGRVHERHQEPGGMMPVPGHCSNTWWRDVGRPVDPDSFSVPTLGHDGDQLAPGRYTVTAVYENRRSHYRSSNPAQPDTASIWSGEIRSAPVTLEVLVATPDVVEFAVYTGVRRAVVEGEAVWQWDPASHQVMTASHRPGYHLGRMLSLRGNGAVCRFSQARSGGLAEIATGAYLCKASSDTIHIDQWIGETSNGNFHMWQPKAGDHRAFFERTIVIPPE